MKNKTDLGNIETALNVLFKILKNDHILRRKYDVEVVNIADKIIIKTRYEDDDICTPFLELSINIDNELCCTIPYLG